MRSKFENIKRDRDKTEFGTSQSTSSLQLMEQLGDSLQRQSFNGDLDITLQPETNNNKNNWTLHVPTTSTHSPVKSSEGIAGGSTLAKELSERSTTSVIVVVQLICHL